MHIVVYAIGIKATNIEIFMVLADRLKYLRIWFHTGNVNTF